jgi:CHRD domain
MSGSSVDHPPFKTNEMKNYVFPAIILAAFSMAQAQTQFKIALDANQESPGGGGRTGSGMGNLTVSATTLALNNINFCGLSANATAARIHGPAGAGANSGVLYDLTGFMTPGATSGTISGSLTLLDGVSGYSIAQQIDQLTNGLWYLRIVSESFSGGEIRGQILSSPAARILAVIRDRDGDPSNGVQMNELDDPVYLDRLTNVLGHEVVLLGNSPGQPASPDDWKTNGPIDMVFISGSVRVADVAAAYRECNVPVIYSEAGISAPQSMADDAIGQAGAVSAQTDLLITNPGHPLAGGLCGTVRVYSGLTGQGRMNFIAANSHLISIGTVIDNPGQAVISGYEKGVCMFDGLPAPARRVNLFMPETETTNALDAGWALFDAGIAWCLSTPSLPEITLMTPLNGAVFAPAGNGITFKASSASPIAAGDLKLTLNSFDESANLVISGEPADRIATFSGLSPNRLYSARITVSNALGFQTAYLDFDTFNESDAKILEAEDYDYDGGSYQLDPTPSGFDAQCSRTPGDPAVGYAGQTGIQDVDYFVTDAGGAANCPYRQADNVGTRETFDVVRDKYVLAMVHDNHVRRISDTEWLHYTSRFNPDSYNVYLRASRIAPTEIRLDKRDVLNGDMTALGTFLVPDTQNCGFSYVPLTDGLGHQASVSLTGSSDTLRLTAVAAHPSLYLNYLLFVKSSVQPPPPPPVIENMRLSGAHCEFTFTTALGRRYTVQSTDSLSPQSTWRTITTFGGTGVPHNVKDPMQGISRQFYRVSVY